MIPFYFGGRMKYANIVQGRFVRRNNRFSAQVELDGRVETVHVKNTGRLRELLYEGAVVYLTRVDAPLRKTAYDLVAVEKAGPGTVNIDSLAPNAAMKEWLMGQDYDVVRPEYTYGGSRFDFYMEKNEEKYLLEVKGCTLEREGIGYFPDAPTERGVKHLRELAAAAEEGYHCALAFVIQMPKVQEVRPNTESHPEFGKALAEAKAAGVKVRFMLCEITPEEIRIVEETK